VRSGEFLGYLARQERWLVVFCLALMFG
jgi:hypothetical protein